MASFFEQVFSLLTTNPGNLAYHLVLAFSIAGALQVSLASWRNYRTPHLQRTLAGLALLLLVRLALFASAAAAWQDSLISSHALPPIDRFVTYLGLVIIVWLWVFPEPLKLADAANLLLVLLVGTFFTLSLVEWIAQPVETTYNGFWLDTAGEILAVLVAALGLILLLVRRPAGWEMGLGMLGLLFAGHLAHLLAPMPVGNYPGAVRLAQMAAYALLFTLSQRTALPVVEVPAAPAAQLPASISLASSGTPGEGGAAAAIDQNLLGAFFNLASTNQPQAIYREIARIVSRLMLADIALLIAPLENRNQVLVRSGSDLTRQSNIEGFILSGQLGETLSNALRRSRPIRLSAASTASHGPGLSQSLGVSRVGPLLAVPILAADRSHNAGLVLLSPSSNRDWSTEDQDKLIKIAELLAPVLQHAEQVSGYQNQIAYHRSELEGAQARYNQIHSENETLVTQLETARQQVVQEQSRASSLAALLAAQEEQQGHIVRLEAELQRLTREASAQRDTTAAQAAASTPEIEQLEGELRLALEEIAHLKTMLSEADRKALNLHSTASSESLEPEQYQTITSISQELRQPLSSITGYTDLLLGESIGIIGAMQRKFLERIRASTERMEALVDDLVDLTVISKGKPVVVQSTVDLNMVIDEAVALSMSQMREKNIVLRVDLPHQLPPIHADRDSLQQILIHLLQNASSATPHEGEISLHARLRQEGNQQDFILLQVSDTGEGIPAEDLPRVFSRLYRASSSQITGTGDTGIGLSIVKSLVEAHGGRIWVDTEPRKGSTFSILLPILTNPVSNNGYEGALP